LNKKVSIAIIGLLLVLSGSCRKQIDNRRVTPLNVPLKKVGELYGVAVGEQIIPETIAIPAGKFLMGSEENEESEPIERPRHQVAVDGFEMGRLEITNAQYASYFKATGYKNEKWEEENKAGRENYPAIGISWDDTVKYCEWLSQVTGRQFRLPTEAEWEYAAGGPQNVRFSWGNGWDTELANVGKLKQETVPVASYPANAFGLYDMTGNVWEWCSDWFDENYYRESQENNPQGPSSGRVRVMRGGAWNSPERYSRITFRSRNTPDTRTKTNGFRVVTQGSEVSGR
jgi:formylglycine-generating enzyme required for sulfatase activity